MIHCFLSFDVMQFLTFYVLFKREGMVRANFMQTGKVCVHLSLVIFDFPVEYTTKHFVLVVTPDSFMTIRYSYASLELTCTTI